MMTPDRQAEEVERGAHPLRVAPGEVVVDRDDVRAAPGQPVEDGGQGRDQRLALAGAHLRDPPLVEDDGPHQLDVVLAHPHRPLHGLAAGGEHLGDHVVEDRLEPLLVALATGLGEVVAALELGVVELVLGGFLGRGVLHDLRADGVHPLADLVVGQGGELVLELVGAVDEGLEPRQLAVVGIEES